MYTLTISYKSTIRCESIFFKREIKGSYEFTIQILLLL